MGSSARSRFINQHASKIQFEANKKPRPQRQALCRICGQQTTGKKYCVSCMDFITKKGKENDRS